MTPRRTLALFAARGASFLSHRLGSGGTVLPGHLLQHIDPGALADLVGRIPHGVVLVSGTNGKTTTARMVGHAVSATGLRPIHNRAGANLLSGVAAAVAAAADLRGGLEGDIGLFEVDEAHVPGAAQVLDPRVLTLTNLFRDQLDRYGEVDLLAGRWKDAVSSLPASATLVVNIDDPGLARLAGSASCKVLAFGVDDPTAARPDLPHEADWRLCPRCDQPITYTLVYYGHLGHYVCEGCGWRRPEPQISLRSVAAAGDGLRLGISWRSDEAEVRTPIPGLYNAYNSLAAVATCVALEIPMGRVAEALSTFGGVFGRQERVPAGAGHLILNLVKNPVGFNQVLAALIPTHSAAPAMVFAINDLLADGTDISWLWDVDFEILASMGTAGPSPQPLRQAQGRLSPRGRGTPRFFCTGLRAHDMALRLKYAMVNSGEIVIEPSIERALGAAVEAASPGGSVPVFASYTAMLEARQVLHRWGHVPPFWRD